MSGPIQTITVFGATGFVGRHLIQHLTRHGAIVRACSRIPTQAAFLKPAGAVGQVVPWAADIGDDVSVRRAIDGADAVINLVGILFERGANTFQAIHVDAAARIARIAAEMGAKRLVHVSAIGANAKSEAGYARSKAEGEGAVRASFPTATILRPSVIFGPEDDFTNRFASLAQLAPALPLFGGGATRFQPVFVGDVAEAIAGAVERADAPGRTYELGGPVVHTFKEILAFIMKEIGRPAKPLIPVPWKAAEFLGDLLGKTPIIAPPLTRDQVEMLKSDNVASGTLPGLKDLGVAEPAAMEVIAPAYLQRFIVGGTYAKARAGGAGPLAGQY